MQLVAYGAQDIYLTGNPQITFFKVVYRRHTNFSMEEIAQTPNGSVSFGGTASYTISRNGDLVHKMYFEFEPATMFAGGIVSAVAGDEQLQISSYIGDSILKEIECEIGGQKIDKHYGHWLSTWADLTERNDRGEIGQFICGADGDGTNTALAEPGSICGSATASSHMGKTSSPTNSSQIITSEGARPTKFQRMSFNHLGVAGQSQLDGADTVLGTVSSAGQTGTDKGSALPKKAQVPLRFWFNRNPGLALPLIALQYHEVKINIKFCADTDITSVFTGLNLKGKLYAQYIYLDTDERRRFAQVSHEYLIEQLQFQSESGTTGNYTLNFNHPVKEIIWGGKPVGPFVTGSTAKDIITGTTVLTPLNSSDSSGTEITTAGPLDNKDCGDCSPAAFNTQGGNAISAIKWQLKLNGHDRFAERPVTYFSRQQILDHHTGFGSVPIKDSILVYSFALKPEEHQPSGTCNFSRIDTAQLIATLNGETIGNGIYIYATNYNVLRIMSGMGGLAYSN